jgi:hypothetical protein
MRPNAANAVATARKCGRGEIITPAGRMFHQHSFDLTRSAEVNLDITVIKIYTLHCADRRDEPVNLWLGPIVLGPEDDTWT